MATFPTKPKDILAFRAAEMKDQKGFKGARTPAHGFGALTDHTARERDYKGLTGKPAGITSGSARAGSVGAPEVDVNVGSGLAPKKSPSLKGYVENTPPPKGRALPVRGEGPTRNVSKL